MRVFSAVLLLFALAACGKAEPTPEQKQAAMQDAARVAERNLVKIRDKVVEYRRKQGVAPENMDQLEALALESSDDYAELGYHFYNVEFDKDGAMTQGWFMAAPIVGRKALRVRLNGVTSEFDHANADDDHNPAPSANTP